MGVLELLPFLRGWEQYHADYDADRDGAESLVTLVPGRSYKVLETKDAKGWLLRASVTLSSPYALVIIECDKHVTRIVGSVYGFLGRLAQQDLHGWIVQPSIFTKTGIATVATAGTAIQVGVGDGIPIAPPGIITILARPGNAGAMYFADTESRVGGAGTRFTLNPGDSIDVAVPDMRRLWFDAANSGDVADVLMPILNSDNEGEIDASFHTIIRRMTPPDAYSNRLLLTVTNPTIAPLSTKGVFGNRTPPNCRLLKYNIEYIQVLDERLFRATLRDLMGGVVL